MFNFSKNCRDHKEIKDTKISLVAKAKPKTENEAILLLQNHIKKRDIQYQDNLPIDLINIKYDSLINPKRQSGIFGEHKHRQLPL